MKFHICYALDSKLIPYVQLRVTEENDGIFRAQVFVVERARVHYLTGQSFLWGTVLMGFKKRLIQKVHAAALTAALAVAPTAAYAKSTPPAHHSSSGSSSSSSSSASVQTINPTSLRQRILNGDTSVLTALNNVYQSKEQVIKARTALLPSINFNALSGPSFAVSAVTFLLPFLVPSNWYNLDASKHQLTADGYAYYITELNAYASALALYMTILGDKDLRDVYQKQYENYTQIYNVVQGAVRVGTETETDLAQAASQMQLARVQVSQIDELLVQEKAAIRSMMGLPITSTMDFELQHLAPLADEASSPKSIYLKIHDSVPERAQVSSLIEAARDGKYAAAWGFVGGSSLSVETGMGKDSSFGKLAGSTGFNLGFGTFPSVEISNLNVQQLQIRETEVDHEVASAVETAFGSLVEAQTQLQQGRLAEQNADKVFQDNLLSYRLGTTDLLHVIEAANTSVSASAGRAKAQSDVDNQRVSFQRILRSNEFAKIPTCNISVASQHTGVFGFFKQLFHPKAAKLSVDVMCRPGAA